MFVNYNKVIFPSILGRNFLFYFPQYIRKDLDVGLGG